MFYDVHMGGHIFRQDALGDVDVVVVNPAFRGFHRVVDIRRHEPGHLNLSSALTSRTLRLALESHPIRSVFRTSNSGT